MNADKNYFEKIAEHGQLIVVSGPSSVGKTTIINEYLKRHPNACRCITVTTREQRPGEVDGEDYFFISHLEFDRMVRTHQLLEYRYANRNGYGTPRRAVEEARDKGRNIILVVDVTGAMKIRALCPDSTLFFILPPTWAELEQRIRKQYGEEYGENEERIQQRLIAAQESILCAQQYDYILVNDTLEKAVRRMDQIVHGNRYSSSNMAAFMETYLAGEIHHALADEVRSL